MVVGSKGLIIDESQTFVPAGRARQAMLKRLRERNEWKFFAVLPQADRALAVAWWFVLLLRGVLPAIFAIAMGLLVAAVQRGDSLIAPLALTGVAFVLLQILAPIHTISATELLPGSTTASPAPACGLRAWVTSRTRA
jgi:hypothetical protein